MEESSLKIYTLNVFQKIQDSFENHCSKFFFQQNIISKSRYNPFLYSWILVTGTQMTVEYSQFLKYTFHWSNKVSNYIFFFFNKREIKHLDDIFSSWNSTKNTPRPILQPRSKYIIQKSKPSKPTYLWLNSSLKYVSVTAIF